MQIDNRYAGILTTQDYSKNTPIEGVKFHPLKYHRDDGGDFTELGRFTDGKLEGFPNFTIRQVNSSLMLPGAVKAFHVHFEQTDIWYVSPLKRILMGLLDIRKNSKTVNKTMRFVLGAGNASLLYVPPGIAHGAANLWGQPATVTYFTDQQFDHQDEHRLPFDLFGEDFWKLKKE